MTFTPRAMLAPVAIAALWAGASLHTPAHAASSEQSRYTHSSCTSANARCGAVVVASAGSFTIDWVALNARGSQPPEMANGTPVAHPDCEGFDRKIKDDVPSGNYDTFVIPASCAYKIKLKVLAGDSKDLNVYLTPGCQIIAKVAGSNASATKWKSLEISTLADEVPTKDGKPIDMAGYKCGKQSGAGF